jgi:thiol-disulfide isomerase/thioredoxin
MVYVILLTFAQNALAADGAGSRGKIMVDASKDGGVWWFPQGEGRFDTAREHQGKRFVDALKAQGWDVEEVVRGADVTNRLQGATIVIRANCAGSYQPSEVDAYRDFVSNGGSVLLLQGFVRQGDEEQDAVARAFGVRFAETVRAARITRWAPSPFSGLLSRYGVGSIIAVSPASAVPLAYLDNGKTVMGAVQLGKGKVLFAGTILGFLDAPAPLTNRFVEALASKEPVSRLASVSASAAAAESTRAQLIGKKAAPLDVETWVNGSPLTDEDFKGKVVLLDFWAVWCGPCIATFPHLREWNEKYADKGLVMIGLTGYYNYDWDDKADKAVRSEEKVAPQKEQAMLVKFATQHKLTHRFGIQKGGSFSKAYGVTGIPQVVIIDRDGVIRLIKVGSGEANARAIGNLLETLLEPGKTAAEASPSTDRSSSEVLEVVSTKPASPALLKPGERLEITIRYALDSAEGALIFARPYTQGKSTPGYRAHPSPVYERGKGELVGWFFFDRAVEVDEVRVEMKDATSRATLKTLSHPLQAQWK